jgi:xylulokinase
LPGGLASGQNAPVSLVGIDIGSSAVKAAAYRADGALLAQAAEAVPSLHPGPGLAEVDGDAVWTAVVAVVQRVTASPRARRDPPTALAVSASGREGFPARANGSALGPCLRTADARRPATEAAVTLRRSSTRWIRDCGHVPDHMDPTNRILWWAEQEPRTMSRARWFLGWHELVSLRLTGRPVVDPALASGFLIFDLASKAWSPERIGALGIDPRVLPEVVPWATPLGPVRPRTAAEMGLPRRCVLVAGSWDGSCAAVGAGVVEEGGALLAAGTWESVVAPLSRPRPREVASARLALTHQPSTPGWGLWARSPNGTSVLDWALGVSGIRLARLEAALASAGPDPSPALMIPHLSGAPGPWPASPGAAGAVFGLTLATTGTDLVRAALEGIAIDLALAFDALRAGGSQPQTCTVAGGGARSPWWMQLKADLLGMPVEICEQAEPGTLGAALLAGVGSGVYGSLSEAAAHTRIERRFEPDERRAARYAAKMAGHRQRAAELLSGPGGR